MRFYSTEWVNTKFAPVNKKNLIEYISKIAANKRKYSNQRKDLKNRSKESKCKKPRKMVSYTREETTEEKGKQEKNLLYLNFFCTTKK